MLVTMFPNLSGKSISPRATPLPSSTERAVRGDGCQVANNGSQIFQLPAGSEHARGRSENVTAVESAALPARHDAHGGDDFHCTEILPAFQQIREKAVVRPDAGEIPARDSHRAGGLSPHLDRQPQERSCREVVRGEPATDEMRPGEHHRGNVMREVDEDRRGAIHQDRFHHPDVDVGQPEVAEKGNARLLHAAFNYRETSTIMQT